MTRFFFDKSFSSALLIACVLLHCLQIPNSSNLLPTARARKHTKKRASVGGGELTMTSLVPGADVTDGVDNTMTTAETGGAGFMINPKLFEAPDPVKELSFCEEGSGDVIPGDLENGLWNPIGANFDSAANQIRFEYDATQEDALPDQRRWKHFFMTKFQFREEWMYIGGVGLYLKALSGGDVTFNFQTQWVRMNEHAVADWSGEKLPAGEGADDETKDAEASAEGGKEGTKQQESVYSERTLAVKVSAVDVPKFKNFLEQGFAMRQFKLHDDYACDTASLNFLGKITRNKGANYETIINLPSETSSDVGIEFTFANYKERFSSAIGVSTTADGPAVEGASGAGSLSITLSSKVDKSSVARFDKHILFPPKNSNTYKQLLKFYYGDVSKSKAFRFPSYPDPRRFDPNYFFESEVKLHEIAKPVQVTIATGVDDPSQSSIVVVTGVLNFDPKTGDCMLLDNTADRSSVDERKIEELKTDVVPGGISAQDGSGNTVAIAPPQLVHEIGYKPEPLDQGHELPPRQRSCCVIS